MAPAGFFYSLLANFETFFYSLLPNFATRTASFIFFLLALRSALRVANFQIKKDNIKKKKASGTRVPGHRGLEEQTHDDLH